ncbi:MAG: hypothetical protein DI535_00660 [Citrobacter freundii]|nr:MAG: hypothetical protein DI535_00660 [Citrobacter freundii]
METSVLSNIKIVLSNESESVYPSEFEAAVGKAFSAVPLEQSDSVELDLSGINYLDIVSVLNISALFEYIAKNHPSIRLSLSFSNNEKLLFFIRQWKIDEGLAKAARVESFLELLSESTRSVYKEYLNTIEIRRHQSANLTEKYGDISELSEINFKYHNLCSSKFFGIKSFDIQNPADKSIDTGIINEEVSRWDIGDIKDVLNFTLRDIDGHRKEGYLPSNVIFECLTNALRHPNGSLLQVGSRHISNNILQNFNKPHFTLVFWDNGTSMIDVLKGGYEMFKSVRAELPNNNELSYPHFQVKLQDGDQFLHETWVDSRIGPDEKYASSLYDYYWFLATFFPGVSSDPKGLTRLRNEDVKPTQSKETSLFHNPGMGLYLLLNTVVDVFNGKIVVRSGHFLMTIQKPTESKQKRYEYAASIKKIDKGVPKFNGNLIAVHLPLWKKH